MTTSLRWMRTAAGVVALAAALVLAAAACGGGKDTSDDPLVVGGMAETITIEDSSYAPGNLQVPAGAAVTWVNEDNAVHDAKADDGGWETDNLRNGESDTVVFEEAGVYAYHCSLHPSMKAKITVVAE